MSGILDLTHRTTASRSTGATPGRLSHTRDVFRRSLKLSFSLVSNAKRKKKEQLASTNKVRSATAEVLGEGAIGRSRDVDSVPRQSYDPQDSEIKEESTSSIAADDTIQRLQSELAESQAKIAQLQEIVAARKWRRWNSS